MSSIDSTERRELGPDVAEKYWEDFYSRERIWSWEKSFQEKISDPKKSSSEHPNHPIKFQKKKKKEVLWNQALKAVSLRKEGVLSEDDLFWGNQRERDR